VNGVAMTRPVALRTALIWRDEVMDDVVADTPRKITIGHKGGTTFVVPDVGLPSGFAILSPGNRGYVLTLGERMRGKICIDGKQQDVADYVARGDGASGPGGFCATPIGGRDWGVIDLDESGDYKLFFQFVPIETQFQNHSDLLSMMTLAGAAGLLFMWGLVAAGVIALTMSSDPGEALSRLAILTAAAVAGGILITHPESRLRLVFVHIGIGVAAVVGLLGIAWVQEQLSWSFLEWVSRGALLVVVGVVLFGMGWSLAVSDPEQQASTGFSIILHGALLIGTIIIYRNWDDPNVWPGPRALTGDYLVSRLEEEKPPEEKKEVGKANKEENAAKQPEKQPRQLREGSGQVDLKARGIWVK